MLNSYFDETDANERCTIEQLNELRMKNPKKVMLCHLNINSIPNKFEGIMDLVAKILDIFLISETKIDNSFPGAQGYSKPHSKDRTLGGGGLLMYLNENRSLRFGGRYIPKIIHFCFLRFISTRMISVSFGITCSEPTN